MSGQNSRVRWLRVSLILLGLGVLGVFSASASAFTAGPGWMLTANSYPTRIAPGGGGAIVVNVMNVGAGNSEGPITITDVLPPGVMATEAGELHELGGFSLGGKTSNNGVAAIGHSLWACAGNGSGGQSGVTGASVVTCTNGPELESIAGGGGNPGEPAGPNRDPQLAVKVNVAAAESSGTNRVTIVGGGAPASASTSDPVTVSSKPAPFGFAGWDVWFSNASGTLDTQAGSHPYEATFSYDLNNLFDEQTGYSPAGGTMGVGKPLENRDLEVKLPPGFVGDPNAVPACTRQQYDGQECPAASQVGILTVTVLGGVLQRFAVYSIVPPAGYPDEIAFTNAFHVETRLDTGLRSGSDYGLTTHINNIVQANVISAVLTLWGVPGDSSHQIWRDQNTGGCSHEEIGTPSCPSVSGEARPFLTLPTSCTGPLPFSIWGNTWSDPNITAETTTLSHDSNGVPAGLNGCEHLGFDPKITTSPDTGAADTPAGFTFDLKPAVGGLESPEGLGTSDVKNTSVTLPEGLVINPGQAAGLMACQESEAHIHDEGVPPACPLKSKVGTVEAEVPILTHALQGNLYVLQSNPPNLRLLLTASGDGVEIKLPLSVHLDETTGRLTTTLDGAPQAPVSDFKLSFSGGAQAALATPTTCGTYTTTTDFASWASPFISDEFPTGAFGVTSGTNGAPCPGLPLKFGPSLIAGSTTDQAGGFTSFSLLLQSADDQQRIEKLQFKIPQGLLGMISQVPLCGEAQASTGTCSFASQIGHTTVASGPGPYPLVVPQPGQPPAPIYLTGPYKGAPYGLSIVVPVVVGPFTLQTQIVRAKIEVDPLTAQITVTTDPFPQMIDGVPTDLRTVNAVIDRPGFMFNPTSCSAMSFSGTAWGTPPPGQGGPGSAAAISSPFQMGSCRSLLFKPTFKVSTSARTSRANGASLDAKIVYPTGPLGANQASSQSNLKSVRVDLPKQLPSRLTTLQKACTSRVFEANPANCPREAKVGTAFAVTPVLPVELTGPAYFVSYGGSKFPELVFALQGYGVTIYVHGETSINEKTNVTSSTFRAVPDVPIYKFELNLPEGPNSALAAIGNLCNTKLQMPTSFTAQDGAVIHQTTPISVTGCTKTRKAKKAKKGNASHKSRKSKR